MDTKESLLVKDLEYLADVATQSQNTYLDLKLRALVRHIKESMVPNQHARATRIIGPELLDSNYDIETTIKKALVQQMFEAMPFEHFEALFNITKEPFLERGPGWIKFKTNFSQKDQHVKFECLVRGLRYLVLVTTSIFYPTN